MSKWVVFICQKKYIVLCIIQKYTVIWDRAHRHLVFMCCTVHVSPVILGFQKRQSIDGTRPTQPTSEYLDSWAYFICVLADIIRTLLLKIYESKFVNTLRKGRKPDHKKLCYSDRGDPGSAVQTASMKGE